MQPFVASIYKYFGADSIFLWFQRTFYNRVNKQTTFFFFLNYFFAVSPIRNPLLFYFTADFNDTKTLSKSTLGPLYAMGALRHKKSTCFWKTMERNSVS
jgi:hypothetical protein